MYENVERAAYAKSADNQYIIFLDFAQSRVEAATERETMLQKALYDISARSTISRVQPIGYGVAPGVLYHGCGSVSESFAILAGME